MSLHRIFMTWIIENIVYLFCIYMAYEKGGHIVVFEIYVGTNRTSKII